MPPKVHVDRILTMDQDVVDDPYRLAAALRRECPVFREPRYNVVVVSRYDDVIDVARRPEDFSSILAAYGPSGADRGPVPAELVRHRGACRGSRPGAQGTGGRAVGRLPARPPGPAATRRSATAQPPPTHRQPLVLTECGGRP